MPTYEYRCSACGHAFEKFQSMSSASVKKCPSCGKSRVQRLIGTGAGLIFKGSGFYITDYRSEGYKSAEKADSGKPAESSDSKSSDNRSSDSKSSDKSKSEKPAAEKPASTKSAPEKPSASSGKSKSDKK
jgi:putative FmdB family regulatory protein